MVNTIYNIVLSHSSYFFSFLLLCIGIYGLYNQQYSLFIILLYVELIIIACTINYFFIPKNCYYLNDQVFRLLFIFFIIQTIFALLFFIDSARLYFFPPFNNNIIKRERVKPLKLINNKKRNYFIIIIQHKQSKQLDRYYYYNKIRINKKINLYLKYCRVKLWNSVKKKNKLLSLYYFKFLHKKITLSKNKKLELLFLIIYTVITIIIIFIILLIGVLIYIFPVVYLWFIIAAICCPFIFFT